MWTPSQVLWQDHSKVFFVVDWLQHTYRNEISETFFYRLTWWMDWLKTIPHAVASAYSRAILMQQICSSIRLSVHYVLVLYENGLTYCNSFFSPITLVLSASNILTSDRTDRTDLSTECGSGPIQLARDRYRAARRSVADSPPHCMNAPQRTLQATGQKAFKKSVRNENIQ